MRRAVSHRKGRGGGEVHVSRLIGDGATLQIGLGSLPAAILESLTNKKDLGVHSGTIGDHVADLVDAGVITNRKKPIDTGKCVAGTLLGSQRLYRWAHRNSYLAMRSPRYTHDILVHAALPRLIGINTALEVDLTGQMNAEIAQGHHVGMREGGLEKLGLKLVVDEIFTPPLADATSIIQKVRSARPEILLLLATSIPDDKLLLEKLNEFGLGKGRLPIIANGAHIGAPELLKTVGKELMEGLMRRTPARPRSR